MSVLVCAELATAFTAPMAKLRASAPLMSAEVTADVKGMSAEEVKSMEGVVVPTGVGVQSWYDSGIRLDGSTVATKPVEPAPVAKAEPEVAKTEPPKPSRPAEWNPQGLGVPSVPKEAELFAQQFVPSYLKAAPTYLDGSMPGDIGFDPWALTVLANPTLSPDALQTLDKTSRTAEERDARMLAMSAEEQQAALAWMRDSELKHGRLAMLAAAGWPLAELTSGSSLRFAGTNGRAPSLFNGHLFDYLPFLVVVFGGLAYLEVTTKDTVKDGDYGFDPLGLASGKGPMGPSGLPIFDSIPAAVPNVGKPEELRTSEIKHGRAAMMAITGFAVQEFVWGSPVVEQTPFFFGK